MSSRLTIFKRGQILIAIPLFFQLIFIGIVAKIRHENRVAEIGSIHTKEVIAQAQRCRARILSAHGAIQGLILTGDAIFGEKLNQIATTVPQEIQTLKIMVDDRLDQSSTLPMVERIDREASEFLIFMKAGQQLVRDGRMNSSMIADRRRKAQELLDRIEEHFELFLDIEQNLDDERHDRLATAWARFDWLLKGGVIVSILFSIGMAVTFTRNISGRIASLTENARRLAESKELTPLIGGDDEIARLDRVFHDMARTLAESAQRDRLHGVVLERKANELAEVNHQLIEKAQENEMFVYSVSHDLRSPLVNLQGFSRELQLIGGDLARIIAHKDVPELVRNQATNLIKTEMAESIGFIQTAVTRLSSIIDALLRLSRAGRVEYRRQSVEVRPIVDRVVAALRGSIIERQATVEIGERRPAWGDLTAIEQIFANLIGNAVNYLDRDRPGKVTIASVENHLESINGFSIYAIRDNGLGIPEQYQGKIFTAFQRLHGDVSKGEGVGLALVRRMVERHGGRVWFESEPGVGSTFFIAFPRTEPGDGGSDPIQEVQTPTEPSEQTLSGSFR